MEYMQQSPISTVKSKSDVLNQEQDVSNLNTCVMLARSEVPQSHRRQADIYMLLKTHYGAPVITPSVTLDEKKLLAKYDFNPLEYSTIKQIKDELSIMKEWSMSLDRNLIEASDKIISIRVKELKNIIATKYIMISNEIYSGYKALEKYLEEISKYH